MKDYLRISLVASRRVLACMHTIKQISSCSLQRYQLICSTLVIPFRKKCLGFLILSTVKKKSKWMIATFCFKLVYLFQVTGIVMPTASCLNTIEWTAERRNALTFTVFYHQHDDLFVNSEKGRERKLLFFAFPYRFLTTSLTRVLTSIITQYYRKLLLKKYIALQMGSYIHGVCDINYSRDYSALAIPLQYEDTSSDIFTNIGLMSRWARYRSRFQVGR